MPGTSNQLVPLSSPLGHGLADIPEDSSQMACRHSARLFFALWEILPAATSAYITTCYGIRHKNAVSLVCVVADCLRLICNVCSMAKLKMLASPTSHVQRIVYGF